MLEHGTKILEKLSKDVISNKKIRYLLYLQEKIISARLIKFFIQKSFANCTTIKRERERKKNSIMIISQKSKGEKIIKKNIN